MARNQGTFEFSANFETKISGTLDARQIVDNFADLLSFTSDNFISNGFFVAVRGVNISSERGIYQCIDNQNLDLANSWYKIGTDVTVNNISPDSNNNINLSATDITTGVFSTTVIPDLAIGKITNLQTTLDGKSNTGHTHPISDITSLQTTLDGKEASFTKNTAFNKDFGTTLGTVAEGNDSRIVDAFEGKVNSVTVTGDSTKIITLTLQDGSTLTSSFTDIANEANGDEYVNSLNWSSGTGVLTVGRTGTLTDITVNLDGRYELSFTKNSAFNKDFGTAVGTVAEGNDSRILNGQTAYSWGNHASAGYVSNGDSLTVLSGRVQSNIDFTGTYHDGNITDGTLFDAGINMVTIGNANATYPTGYGLLTTFKSSSDRMMQIFSQNTASEFYMRVLYNTNAIDWVKLHHTGNLNPVTLDTTQTITADKTYSGLLDVTGDFNFRFKNNDYYFDKTGNARFYLGDTTTSNGFIFRANTTGQNMNWRTVGNTLTAVMDMDTGSLLLGGSGTASERLHVSGGAYFDSPLKIRFNGPINTDEFNLYTNGNRATFYANSTTTTTSSGFQFRTSDGAGSFSPLLTIDHNGDTKVYGNLQRSAHNTGHLEGSYNNVAANGANTNPIYTIGSSYNPLVSGLSNMYGIGYANGGQATFLSSFGGSWGMYVAAAGTARIFLDAMDGTIKSTSVSVSGGNSTQWNTAYGWGDHASQGYTTNTYPRTYIRDSRGAPRTPDYFTDRYAQWDFQPGYETGASGDTWHGILTVSKWSGYTSDHRQEQLNFSGTNLQRRTASSDTAWGAWKTIYDTGNDSNLLKTTGGSITGKIAVGSTNNRSAGIYGIYDSTKIGHVWSMDVAYDIPDDGSNFGNLYGIAYKYQSGTSGNQTGGQMAGGHQILFVNNGSANAAISMYSGNIWSSGTVTASNITMTSDIRYKENIRDISDASDMVSKIDTFYHTWKNSDNKEETLGVSAQQLKEVLPQVVYYDETDDKYTVSYVKIIPLLIESNKELIKKNENLYIEKDNLINKINELEERIKKLEQ